jgi:acetamidase/formamidase
MPTHTIKPSRETLHGDFNKDRAPILSVDSGDTMRFSTLDADWITNFNVSLENPPKDMAALGTRFEPRQSPEDDGHALCGPVYVNGAKPGMALAVHIHRVIPGQWGWVFPWFGTPYEQKHTIPLTIWQLDTECMVGRNPRGHSVALKPFMGVMGVAPAEAGVHSTTPPRNVGGNMDCKELVAGSTLYLPIEVEGALFSLGDGHAVQGDGETGGTAIECPMDLVELSLELIEKPLLPTPYANTPAGWLVMGFDEDLQLAHDKAMSSMQDFLAARYNMTRHEALGLMGVVVDMRITQTVNRVRGVHALLPHGAIR